MTSHYFTKTITDQGQHELNAVFQSHFGRRGEESISTVQARAAEVALAVGMTVNDRFTQTALMDFARVLINPDTARSKDRDVEIIDAANRINTRHIEHEALRSFIEDIKEQAFQIVVVKHTYK